MQQLTTIATAVAGVNPLHIALAELISERTEKSVMCMNNTPLRGNWRTRQVIRELRGIRSIEDVFLREEEFRGVVITQETRRRAKLFGAFLSGQFIVLERVALCEEEQRHRQSLTSIALLQLNNEATFFAFVMNEMYYRHLLENAFLVEMTHHRACHDVALLELLEQRCRSHITQVENLNRIETERRKFLAVCCEIDMELLRQQLGRFTLLFFSKTTKFVHDVALLSTMEERERCSIERFYLVKLSLMANDQENEAARLVVNSVMRAALMRRRLENDISLRERASRLLLFPLKESDIRCIIERKEMEERQEIRVKFMLTWREIYKRPSMLFEEGPILCSLELYERRCLFDQWRFGFNAVYERQMREKSIIMQSEAVFDVFFHSVVDSLTALWNQENEQFNCIRKLYLDFLNSRWMLQASAVLDVEECCARRKIIDAELTERIKAQASLYVYVLETVALRKLKLIMEMEAQCYKALLRWNSDTMRELFFERLCSEEEFGRLDIESMASVSWVDILLKVNLLQGSSVNTLKDVENGQRTLIVAEEKKLFLNNGLMILCSAERRERCSFLQKELFYRVSIYARILKDVEEKNRLELDVERRQEFFGIFLSFLEHREQIMRKTLERSERERRAFLFASFDYFFPYLRACEVDELNARLEIVYEAQLAMGALACTHGVQWHLTDYLEELHSKQRAMHFMPFAELLQHKKTSIVSVVEPLLRGKIQDNETFERFLLTLQMLEQKGRISIEKNARDAYKATQELFDRVISRADQWRTRGVLRDVAVLTGREALIDYFRRHEASFAAKRKIMREKARKVLASFIESFYWSRDTIVVEENIARDGIINRFSLPNFALRPATEQRLSRLTVRFYSLSLTENDELGVLLGRVYDSIDDAGLSFELCEAQAVHAAGRVFRTYFPLRPVTWVRLLETESTVIYFEIRDSNGEIAATASFFLRSEDLQRTAGSSLVSIPSDNTCGKINVLLYVE